MPYKKNFIEQAIARIDFASPVMQLDTKVPPEFDKHALRIFPIKEPRREFVTASGTISPRGYKPGEKKSYAYWQYFSRKKENKLELLPTHMDIVFTEYKSYQDLRNCFIKLTGDLNREISEIVIRRFGLRFVNNIEITDGTPPQKWDYYLSKKLLAIFRIPRKRDEVLRAFHILSIRHGDISLDFRYGMHNPDFPAPIKKKAFMLDYDAYYEGLLEPKDIPHYFDVSHKKIYELFESCITDNLRNKMGIVNEPKKKR